MERDEKIPLNLPFSKGREMKYINVISLPSCGRRAQSEVLCEANVERSKVRGFLGVHPHPRLLSRGDTRDYKPSREKELY